jgi:hypothetical protein
LRLLVGLVGRLGVWMPAGANPPRINGVKVETNEGKAVGLDRGEHDGRIAQSHVSKIRLLVHVLQSKVFKLLASRNVWIVAVNLLRSLRKPGSKVAGKRAGLEMRPIYTALPLTAVR